MIDPLKTPPKTPVTEHTPVGLSEEPDYDVLENAAEKEMDYSTENESSSRVKDAMVLYARSENTLISNSVIKKIVDYFAGQPIEKAWVFGSFARSEQRKNSDIDILVNFTADAKITLFKYIHIANELRALTGRKIDLVEEGQLKSFAKDSVGKDKILIYERKTT